MQEAVTDLTWQKEPSVSIRWIVILSLVTNVVFLTSANHILGVISEEEGGTGTDSRMMMLMTTLKTMVVRMRMIRLVMRN